MAVETAVVLMNLGGPDRLEDVEPFLFNIFSDPDVIPLPLGFLWRGLFARRLAHRRAPESQEIYRKIGGRSPILELTREQGHALEERLGPGFKTYVAMRAWKPFTAAAVEALVADGAQRIVALPLYPQRTRAMTVSSMRELFRQLKVNHVSLEVHEVCCYPDEPGLLEAWADSLRSTLAAIPEERRDKTHVLFSAHGLPQSVIDSGDPYLEQVQRTVAGVMAQLGGRLPHRLSFQSRATRAKWLEPSTQDALTALAREGVRDVAVVPIAFLSEHVETLYELDLLIRDHALQAGIPGYHRVRAPHCAPKLIGALASLITRALEQDVPLCRARPGDRACPRVADPRR